MAHCTTVNENSLGSGDRIALVGNPNVGKSILFHRLTGKYVIVSNYPGTTVEITQGLLKGVKGITLVDTPGIVSFPSRSEDEHVTERVLITDPVRTVLQVGDAKNIRRTLHLTVQLAEMGVPLALALNMMDEAKARGLKVDAQPIEDALGIPVILTVATRGQGLNDLLDAISGAHRSSFAIEYPQLIEQALNDLEARLPQAAVSGRSLGLLWLSEDSVTENWLCGRLESAEMDELRAQRVALADSLAANPAAVIRQTRDAYVEQLAQKALTGADSGKESLGVRLGRLATHPLWGLPILLLVLYAMYWFVGVFGASTLVGWIEGDLFGNIINPWLTNFVQHLIPNQFISDFFVGEYGLWTMGMTYAIALLLPIVFTFFISFGILEDSGYLPRLAVLTNRLFSMIGLNGQAVLPMVLGLGCVTMATMTTRILNRPRDRFLVTLLLALAVPCSAQLGVVMGMLAGISLGEALIWAGVVLLVLLLVGWLAAKLTPGERMPLVVELPPLRMPVFSNVLAKTFARMEWYIQEAVPLFLLGTVLLFGLDKAHLLPGLINAFQPVVTGWLGLPAEAASSFLLGFIRRDFAATGLYLMQAQGLLNPVQTVVSITTITLFVPCIASVFVIIKERGWKIAAGMVAFIFPFALLVGGLLERLLLLVGWGA
ncbi:MAG TPA: ferrous iron transport protein B [Bellilinea sp.]|nr:ferrous iron transport protein B [Bellilinea sp.]